ncbi:HtaA domain-containing protein [Arthrobacter sp. I2-34]|uniref:HtaA domain-containing protein n=1 Tax=Arthrobacter hankyongi TaxID=2904801 RepID=A0ABS9L392_9MICC|nr:HtaA domain-containing protein [Arthrobacter hankyongi]MCG2621115.1 HtaA domain-containing protein [Arthrobacter hankyongi]
MTEHARPFGGMTWSIKDSLLSYVGRAHGEVTLAGDVVSNQGSFSWPLAAGSGQEKDGTLTLRFEGSVVLQAHHGVFQVGFSDLSLCVDGDELLLLSDDISDKPFLSGSYRKQLLEQGVALISDAPRLLEAGVDAFGGNYSEGTEFDPLIVVFNEVDWLLSSHA